uniref:Putative secreted protein n=1 Tax=Ixodes ricinus TaxID=34613 RepID=A0A6B0U9M7_IXORI
MLLKCVMFVEVEGSFRLRRFVVAVVFLFVEGVSPCPVLVVPLCFLVYCVLAEGKLCGWWTCGCEYIRRWD